jgi:hypothetical protein
METIFAIVGLLFLAAAAGVALSYMRGGKV